MPDIIVSTPVSKTVNLTAAVQTPGLPVRVTAGGTIAPPAGHNGIVGSAAYAWTVDNQGYVAGVDGIQLLDLTNSGSIANAGTVMASTTGIDLAGTGTVDNSGFIRGDTDGIALAGGSIGNTGSIDALPPSVEFLFEPGAGIALGTAGGTVTNSGGISGRLAIQSHGATDITNRGAIYGVRTAIDSGGALTLTNSGTITAAGVGGAAEALYNAAVYFDGGSVTNSGTIAGVEWGVFATAPATIGNTGTIAAIGNSGFIGNTGQAGIDLQGGGTVDNGGSIYGFDDGVAAAGSVHNTGTIAGPHGAGVLAAMAYHAGDDLIVSNLGSITGAYGIAGRNRVTVTNSGVVTGSDSGIAIHGPLKLTNSGTITGSGASLTRTAYATSGVYLRGGTVTNTGSIGGAAFGVDLVGSGAAGTSTLTNQGTITSPDIAVGGGAIDVSNSAATAVISGTSIGISLDAGASIFNAGTIVSSQASAIDLIGGGTTTITNDGLIQGATAVLFADGTGGLAVTLAENPGASLAGGAIIATGATVTLELAAGPGTGTLDLGSMNGGAIAVDAAANWQLPGTLDLVNTTTLTLGTSASLAIGGNLALGPGATLAATGDIGGNGTISLADGALFSLAGSATPTLLFQAPGATVDLLTPGTPTGTIAGFAATDIIDLAGLGNANVVPQGNTLDITPAVGPQFSLAFAAGTNMSALTITPDGLGNLLIGHS
jgi:hypothetical protein